MNRYKVKRNRFGWIGLFQTSLNWKNCFQLNWCFICTELHPSIEFGFTILGFVLPIINRGRELFGIHFYTWGKSKSAFLSIGLFYLPSIDFRIGNNKTWFWIRNENIYIIGCTYRNRKAFKSFITIIFLFTLLSCERIPETEHYPIKYTGQIIYTLPSFTDTCLSIREVYQDSVVWWRSKNAVNYSGIGSEYTITNVQMVSTRNSCADTVKFIHNGTGTARGDSMFESGEVEYYIRVGVIEVRQVGRWVAKLCVTK